jgi:DNA invertase Pin-like site-specific DNA recombinase
MAFNNKNTKNNNNKNNKNSNNINVRYSSYQDDNQYIYPMNGAYMPGHMPARIMPMHPGMHPGMMPMPYYRPDYMPDNMMQMQPGMMPMPYYQNQQQNQYQNQMMNPYYQPQMMNRMQMQPMQPMQNRIPNQLVLPLAGSDQPIIEIAENDNNIENSHNIKNSIKINEKVKNYLVNDNEEEDNEEEDNEEDNEVNLEARDGAVGWISEVEDDDENDVIHIPPIIIKSKSIKPSNSIKPSKSIKPSNSIKSSKNNNNIRKEHQVANKVVKNQVANEEVVNNAADNLANMLDNVLDAGIGEPIPIREHYAQFGQEDDNSNVIISIKPVDKNNAHYNNVSNPDEIYNATMFNGGQKTYSAKDLSEHTLETSRIVNTFNNNQKTPVTGGKAFIYARCSTANDISIDTQLKACLQYAQTHNMELLPFGYQYDNGISGRNMKNLETELGFWYPHIPSDSHLIIYSVDRLSRHLVKGMIFLDEMATRNITVHFIMSELVYTRNISSASKARIQQELQTAEQYSNMLSERVRKTQKRLLDEGHVLGGRAKYGFKNIKVNGIRKRILDNHEQKNIHQIQARYLDYVQNYDNNPETQGTRRTNAAIFRALIRWCNRNGLHNRNGQPYTQHQLKGIVNLPLPENQDINNHNHNQ